MITLLAPPQSFAIEEGDYLKYEVSMNTTAVNHNLTLLVLGVNSTSIFYKQIEQWDSNLEVNYYNESKNQTYFAIDPDHPPIGTVMTKIGQDVITINSKNITTDHYFTTSETQPLGELWICNGVVVKKQVQNANYTEMMLLVDSNMKQVN